MDRPQGSVRAGLRRIISIDAIFPGVTSVMDLDDHTSLTGANGAGKTTLLRLIPLFYGAAPSRIQSSRGAARSSLTELLLGRETSLLIFEYQTVNAPACVVMYAQPNDGKLIYLFVPKAFTPELFQKEDSGRLVFMKGHELLRAWKMQGISSHKVDTAPRYRALLLGSTQLATYTDLRNLAPFYSLGCRVGTKARSIEWMDLVTLSILDRNADIEHIQKLIASILESNGASLPACNFSGKLADDVEMVKALQDIEREDAVFRDLVAAGAEEERIKVEIIQLAGEFAQALERVQAERQGIEKALSELDEHKAVEEERLSDDVRNAYEQVNNAQDKVTRKRRELDVLKGQHATYGEEKAAQRLADYLGLPGKREALDAERARLDRLNSDVNDEQSRRELQYERDKSHENERFRRESDAVEGQLRNERIAVAELSGPYYEELTTLIEGHRDAANAVNLHFDDKLKTLEAEIQEWSFTADREVETEQERSRLEEAGRAVEAAEQRQVEQLSAESVAEQRRAAAIAAYQQALDAHLSCEKALERLKDEIARLNAQLSPAPGSWLAQLHRDMPDWHATIGRVVRQEVLEETGVRFELTDPDANTVMGWSLDIATLSRPAWALSHEELQLQLQAREADQLSQEGALERAENARQKAKKEADLCCAAYSTQKTVSQTRADELRAAKQSLKHIEQEIQEQIQARRESAKVKAGEAQGRYTAVKAEKEQQLQQLQSRHDADLGQHESRYERLRAEAQGRIDGLEAQKQLVQERFDEAINRIETDYQGYIDGCGPSAIERTIAQKNVERLQRAIADTQADKEYVEKYENWIKFDWVLYDNLSKELGALNRELSAKQAAHTAAEGARNTALATIKAEREQLMDSQRAINGRLSRIKSWVDRLPGPPETGVPNSVRDLTALEADGTMLTERAKKLALATRTGIIKAERVIISAGRTGELADAWALACSEAMESFDESQQLTDEASRLSKVRALGRFLDDQVPQIRRGRASAIDAAGTQVVNFFHGLSAVKNKVTEQSNQISRAIEGRMHFPTVKDVRIRLISKIESYEFWPELERFLSRWELWKSQLGDLPDLETCSSLLRVIARINGSGMSQSGLGDVFALELSAVENGRRVVATKTSDLKDASSNGLNYLILMSIYAGLTRMLCGEPDVLIHWPVDELGVLSGDNIPALFTMLEASGIIVVSGSPDLTREMLKHFKHRWNVVSKKGIEHIQVSHDRLDEVLRKRRVERDAGAGAAMGVDAHG